MKIGKDEIKEFTELLAEAEQFRPLVRAVIDTLKSYSDELKEIPEAMGDWIVQRRIKHISAYKAAGFSQDDAIIMTLDDIYSIKKLSDKMNRNKK